LARPFLERVETDSLVGDQDCRAIIGTIGQAESSDHASSVGLVVDLANCNHMVAI